MTNKMFAIVKTRTSGLGLIEIQIPAIGIDDVLIKVQATAICGSDMPIFTWDDPWVCRTVKEGQIIGHEFCGIVVQVGKNVRNINEGDFVTAEGHIFCGNCYHCRTGAAHICPHLSLVGFNFPGAFAQYVRIPSRNIVKLGNLPLEVAAIQDPFGNAVHAISKVNVASASVLVTGCGPVGLMVISLVSTLGAKNIFASDISEYRVELAKNIGAKVAFNPSVTNGLDHIISGTKETEGVDLWFEMSGSVDAIRLGFQATRPGGEIVLLGLPKNPMMIDLSGDIIEKGMTIHSVIGREIFRTWDQSRQFLADRNSKIYKDLNRIITHSLPFTSFIDGFNLMLSGNCGKVILRWDN